MAEKEYVKSKGIGGQAVIEGVMMRGKGMYALAVRTPDHQVVVEKTKITGIGLRKGIFRYPVFRGMAAFVDSLIIGTKTLMRSAELAGEGLEEEGEPSKFEKWITKLFGDKTMDVLIYFSVGLSLVMAIALFFLLPVVIGSFFKNILPGTWALSIVEGLVRIAIFIGYLVLISHMKDIQRV